MTATGPGVIAANLVKGVPFPDESFDVVYHSHLLEHFPKKDARNFLRECNRILRPGGVIRVVVPDLEAIARSYLLALENARNGIDGWEKNYEWMVLEMYDQVVRNTSGGDMIRYLQKHPVQNYEFVTDRCGAEVENLIAAGKETIRNSRASRKSLGDIAEHWIKVLGRPQAWRERVIRLLLGGEYEALEIGRFRLGGENHQWMYDSFSLGKLLEDSGFNKVIARSATDSYLPDWPDQNLDTEKDGSVHKPDSLFVEAIKP
jgi:SAM-dependent methyltransferase